jgi:hypothetical protein
MSKITTEHLVRSAYVYISQPTAGQPRRPLFVPGFARPVARPGCRLAPPSSAASRQAGKSPSSRTRRSLQYRGHHRAAKFLEHLWPHDEIGDAGLVFERNEHDALGRARPLAHQHQAGGFEPAAVARLHRIHASDDATRLLI